MHIDQALFQDMSTRYAEVYNFPPLTANIYTYLLFDFEQTGLTFEDIQEAMRASKSSISNALNRLQQTNHIDFFHKIGDRKRYYRINKEIFILQFNEELIQYKKNKNLLDRFAQFRLDNFKDDIHNEKIKLHLQLLQNKIDLQEKMIAELQLFNQQNTD